MLNYISPSRSRLSSSSLLGVFWEPLRTSPGDIIGGIVLIAALAAHVKGTQSRRSSTSSSDRDLATQICSS